MTHFSTAPTGVVIGVLAIALAGCGVSPESGSAPVPTSTAPAPVATPSHATQAAPSPSTRADTDQFCALAAPMLVPVEREFIGSDAHVAQFAALREAAPQDLVEVIATLERHYDVDVSPANPDSQDFDNFPRHIQDQALALNSAIEARCDATT